MTARMFWYSEHTLSLHSDWKHVDNNSHGLILSLITVSLLKQGFCLYKFSLHTMGDGTVVGNQKRKRCKSTHSSRLRQGAFPLHWYFPLLGNKCSLFKDHVNNCFYALLHCMKKAAPVMASSPHPCDLTASESTSLTQIPLWHCGIISVGNSSVLLEGCKSIHFISICLIHKPSLVNCLVPKIICDHISLPFALLGVAVFQP